jgi:hypothetical protein
MTHKRSYVVDHIREGGNRAAISIDIEEGNRPGHPGAVARSGKETGTYLQSAATGVQNGVRGIPGSGRLIQFPS